MVDGTLASLLVVVGHASPVIARDFSAEANSSLFASGLLRGACPERDSSVSLLPQNDKERRARNDIKGQAMTSFFVTLSDSEGSKRDCHAFGSQ